MASTSMRSLRRSVMTIGYHLSVTNLALVKTHALSVLVGKLMRWMAAVAGFNGIGGLAMRYQSPNQRTRLMTRCCLLGLSEHLNNNSFRCSAHDTIVRHLSTTQVSSPVRPK